MLFHNDIFVLLLGSVHLGDVSRGICHSVTIMGSSQARGDV